MCCVNRKNMKQMVAETLRWRMIFYLGWLLLLVGGGKTGGDWEKRWPDDPGPRSTEQWKAACSRKLLRVASCSFSFLSVIEMISKNGHEARWLAPTREGTTEVDLDRPFVSRCG